MEVKLDSDQSGPVIGISTCNCQAKWNPSRLTYFPFFREISNHHPLIPPCFSRQGVSVLSEEGESTIALASFTKWVYHRGFRGFSRYNKLYWRINKRQAIHRLRWL